MSGMPFVGREKEIKQIQKALKRGNNVILTGKYGIGRTSLIRHIAEITQEQWPFVFMDFSQTPGKVCQHLMGELLFREKFKGRDETLGYKAIRFRISTLDFEKGRKPVLVLDNIGKLSTRKMDLIRYLSMAKRFHFVAIAENFLSEEKLFSLRACLNPALLMKVSYLSQRNGREFFRHYAARHRLLWTENEISSLAEMTGGYPLRMREVANRTVERLCGLGGLGTSLKSNRLSVPAPLCATPK